MRTQHIAYAHACSACGADPGTPCMGMPRIKGERIRPQPLIRPHAVRVLAHQRELARLRNLEHLRLLNRAVNGSGRKTSQPAPLPKNGRKAG
ncbi:MAG TPA: hypothetical protein VNK82_03615 [Terriglobales bacterium]|nr:hypothetical protein [Terriglobales bacterium]